MYMLKLLLFALTQRLMSASPSSTQAHILIYQKCILSSLYISLVSQLMVMGCQRYFLSCTNPLVRNLRPHSLVVLMTSFINNKFWSNVTALNTVDQGYLKPEVVRWVKLRGAFWAMSGGMAMLLRTIIFIVIKEKLKLFAFSFTFADEVCCLPLSAALRVNNGCETQCTGKAGLCLQRDSYIQTWLFCSWSHYLHKPWRVLRWCWDKARTAGWDPWVSLARDLTVKGLGSPLMTERQELSGYERVNWVEKTDPDTVHIQKKYMKESVFFPVGYFIPQVLGPLVLRKMSPFSGSTCEFEVKLSGWDAMVWAEWLLIFSFRIELWNVSIAIGRF